MKPKTRFPRAIVAAIRDSSILRIRAGNGPHRFIGIWAVVVEGRVFVRSWEVRAGGWYRTFLVEPRGAILLGEREIPVRAVQTRSERLKDAVSRAYLEKYTTPGSIKYARGLGRAKCRATTTELVPRSRPGKLARRASESPSRFTTHSGPGGTSAAGSPRTR
ncbi:MAG TPA: DUF2255 family protein [Gemmataceae bacterium]|nr:DUF2255 family protein [Gemmataceae bacterium]